MTPASSHRHLTDGVRLASRMGAAQVLSRALCRFRYLPFHDLPKKDRLGYLQVQLLTWAPFPEPEFALVMGEQGAVVLAWDQAAFNERCATAGIPANPGRLIPETLLHPALHKGVTLRRCLEGVEGLVWREGVLVASRWWPQMPAADGWLNFQRGAGVLPEDQEIEPPTLDEAVLWSGTPWAEPRRLSELLGRDRFYEHVVIAFATLALMLPSLWLVKGWLATDGRVTALTREMARLEEAAQPVMQARTEAMDALVSLEAMARVVDHPNPVILLAHLSRQLPKDGTVLREFSWEKEQVRLVILPPPAKSRIVYVEALESGGWLNHVREVAPDSETAEQGVVLVADLTGTAPPAVDAEQPVPGEGGEDHLPAAEPAAGGAGL